MKKKTIRLISLALSVVLAVSTIVYVNADDQAITLKELFSADEEEALSDSAIEAEAGETAEPEETEETTEQAPVSDSAPEEVQQADLTSATVLSSGSCGDNATYTLYDDGEMVISGTGKLVLSTSFEKTWQNYYVSDIKKITVESGITGTYNSVFEKLTSLESITLPDTFTYIGTGTFYKCKSLKSITLPSGVTEIGYEAFYECESLESINIPDSVKSIGDEAFTECTALKSIVLPDSVTSLGYSAFFWCTSLKDVTLSKSITTLNRAVFYNTALESITIPDSVININKSAFQECTSLKSVTIPDSVASIGDYAFADCTSLTSITIPYTVISIGESVFESSGLTTVYCYSNSAADDSSLYPDGVNIVYLGEAPATVTVTGVCGDNAKFSVYSDGTMQITGTGDMYDYNYSSPTPWDSYKSIITSVTVEDGITRIGDYAFDSCTALASITIPDSVTSIGESAFGGCTALASITIPDSVTSIGDYAFDSCEALTSIIIPDSVTSLGVGAFSGCSSLKSAVIGNSVKKLSSYVFAYCDSLTSITIPDSVKTIERGAFYYCKKLTSVDLGEGVTSLAEEVFSYCTSLKSITIPDSVTSIGNASSSAYLTDGTFYYCTSLASVDLGQSLTSIGTAAFLGCSSLTSVIIPESVTSIGRSAFYNCSSINSFYIPETAILTNKASIEGFSSGVTVYCYSDTLAYTYANELGYNIFILDEHEHTYTQTSASGSCTVRGYTKYTCSTCGYRYTEYFGGEGHQYGDWIVESEATIFSDGYKYRECSVCGEREEITTDRLEYDGSEGYGFANLTVVNGSTLEPLEGVAIHITTENDGEGTVYTGSDGTVSVTLPVGKVPVVVSADGYTTRNLNITVAEGEQDIATIGLSSGAYVEGILTATPMTYDEIIEAGIDVDAEDNNQVYKYTVTFTFTEETIDGKGYIDYTAYFGSSGTNYSTPEKFVFDSGKVVTISPISESYYLVITGETKWLKEMFDVQLVVINNSATDTIENCQAELVLPEGLSLASMTDGEQSLVKTFDTIAESGTDVAHWYVRGDEEGEYYITAKLDGELMPFEESFSYEYTTADPVKVYAGSALQMTIKAPGATYYNDDYTVSIELENVSDKTLYNLTNTITGLSQFKAKKYRGSLVIEEAYVDTETDSVQVTVYNEDGTVAETKTTTPDDYIIGTASAEEFEPGDKLVVEVTANILFESNRLSAMGAEMLGEIAEAQKILDAYNTFTAGSEILSSAYMVIEGAETNISLIVNDEAVTSDSKKEAYALLLTDVTALKKIAAAGGNEALGMISRLEKAGVYAKLYGIYIDSSYYNTLSESEINSLVKTTDAILNSCSDEEFQNYDVFNILKSMAESIPVSFILKDVCVNTLEGSTTEIPWTVEIVPGDSPVDYSVGAVGRYLYEILHSATGLDVPRYVGIYGKGSGAYGYNELTKQITMVQDGTTVITAESATGNTSFKAWVVDADGVQDSSFTLSSDNETAYFDDNGRLNFTGPGFINIIPGSVKNGTLYVEMTENGTTETAAYGINVVSPHTCSGEWITVVEPTEESDGYMVKVCDTCGDVIDIKTTCLCESHSFGEYVVETEASETEYGLKVRTCETCGYKEYSVIRTTNALELTGDSEMTIDGGNSYVTGSEAEVSISEFLENFENDNILVYDNNGEEVTDMNGYIATGFVVQNIYQDTVTDQLVVIIKGDVNSDGKKSVADIVKIFNHIQETDVLTDPYLQAAYINSDGMITVADLVDLFNEIQG